MLAKLETDAILRPTKPGVFEGAADIKYLSPGNYGFKIISLDTPKIFAEYKDKISIGTTSDLLDKRTNDILLYLAVMTFLLTIIFGLFPDKKEPDAPYQLSGPTKLPPLK
jgi:hypothetical protein